MTDQVELRQHPLPEEMRLLLDTYPRDAWRQHPNFKEATRNWLAAHHMFRRLSEAVRKDAEELLDGQMDSQDYAARLSYRGNALVGNLQGHHGWEDHSYFPELSAADPRFDAGLEILENDHQVLDEVLHDFVDAATRTLHFIALNRDDIVDEAAKVHGQAQVIEKLLARHLADEEDLAVPIILHHKLRG
ncbi:MAG: hemerythrin domain-containing protein [Rhizobiaceae bacterium]